MTSASKHLSHFVIFSAVYYLSQHLQLPSLHTSINSHYNLQHKTDSDIYDQCLNIAFQIGVGSIYGGTCYKNILK
jgi:hypothetical protein